MLKLPRLTLLSLAVCALLSACAITQVAPPAPQDAPARFKESAGPDAATMQNVPDAWWTLFQDPVLDDLERRVVIGNESIKSSQAQLASAQAVLGASRSATGPTLSANLNGTRTANAQSTAAENPSNSVSLTATASWEVDLWGRLSMATQGAEASLNASQADLAAARLSVQAAVAQNYFSLRAAEAQQALLERNVQAYQRALELTRVRYNSGVVGLTDVLQAQTQLSSVQTQLADMQAQRAQLEHTLAVLLGEAPAVFSIAPTATLPQAVAVPALLPSTLLERRPDIAAARERVKAAYAQIGVTDAALFPTLNLSATAGYSQSSIANLLSTPNLLWSLGASLGQSILDGGSRQLASAQARTSADQVTSSYRQLVLTALQEVEDNLVLSARLSDEVQSQTLALQAAQRNLEIVMEQYRAGTVSYLNVSSAQSSALSSEATLVSVRNRQLIAINTLLKNIAGRWQM
ncbi:efflux transporter outer membrane subunit [Rhodoferax sp. GW822-FHT02A01]|uniref:efflux transporter outer membrane subunit n=1 Tax=Rhodoferax sp. GW822-FHT02A01 TaxID=3141537 RepID=UPI00315D9B63